MPEKVRAGEKQLVEFIDNVSSLSIRDDACTHALTHNLSIRDEYTLSLTLRDKCASTYTCH